MSGQRVMSNPHHTLSLLNQRKEQLQEELRTVEKQLYDLETTYLHDSSQCGNVLKGFEGFLSSMKGSGNLKRPRKFQPEDRLFSLSSVTSPVVEELSGGGRDADGKLDSGGPGRSKSNGLFVNGPGKQKRGRTGPREGKRIKQVTDHGQDEEDEVDGFLK
ncbi:uncharacterized protein [Physcomitrium patens]|uniref:Chromatin modification-related protein MEAF6 n=1 Tax=Physcomitrium patens TaxID=3218 RepID=A9TXS4_PHYPA|nr:hypothetical protein PHYPA_011576 [Physcomitrium patens]